MPNPVVNRRMASSRSVFDPALCNVFTGANYGGDTFDCYPDSVELLKLPLAGTYFSGKWSETVLFRDIVSDDTFDTYSDGVALGGLAGGSGFSSAWVTNGMGADELDPSTVANVLGVYDVQDIVASNGDPISQWDDSSGNGRHLTQATPALQPIYTTGVFSSGGPALRFTDKWFNIPDISGASEYEVFCLVKIDDDPPPAVGQSGLWKLHPTGASNAEQYPSQADGRIKGNFASTTQKATFNPITAKLNDWRVYNVVSKAGLWTVYLDAYQHYTTASNTVSMPNSGLTLGYENYNSGAILIYLRGYIAFFAIFGRVLTAVEREGITNYISARKV